MKPTKTARRSIETTRTCLAIAVSALIVAGCGSMGSTAIGPPGGGIGMPGGVSMPGGGGSSGGGSSGGGTPPSGGSSGGGQSGGGSSGGGMEGGGQSGGGSSGGGSMPSGDTPGANAGGAGTSGAGGANGSDCSDGGITGGGFGGGNDSSAGCDQTGNVGEFPGDSERAEQLGEELDKSVGDFDEALGEEQRQVSSVGRDTEGFGDGSSGSGGSISLGEQEAGASSGGGAGAGGGAGGAAGSEESQAGPLDGMSDQEIQARTPDDIEVNAFDDIVARQLREAALAEDDPELRERLWEEYRKYSGMK